MLDLSPDPEIAREQLRGLIFYLATFSYIDGDFDPQEMAFVKQTIRKVIEHRVDAAGLGNDPGKRQELVDSLTTSYERVFAAAQNEVAQLLAETVAESEQRETFVSCRLKQRCFEILGALPEKLRHQMLATVDDLVMADGQAHAAEVSFRQELVELFEEAPALELESNKIPRKVVLEPASTLAHTPTTHRFFDQLEANYTQDPARRRAQLAFDRQLIDQTLRVLAQQRAAGQGKLAGKSKVDQLADEEPFLDEFVYSLPPRSGHPIELIVLGDTHGCYSCLKAALIQSRFFDKLAAYRADPTSTPDPKLVLLGDYIDRGRYSFEGVLRLALSLFLNAPEHVYILRGNHELFVEHQGDIHSAVRPAEAIEGLRRLQSEREHLEALMHLFNALPVMLLFGRLLLVHGGIPRDRLIKEKLKGLSDLNDPTIRFQMMWSDPSSTDVIPRSLQEATYRFGFGRLQCSSFLDRLGCHTLIRGHDQVEEGFRIAFDDEECLAATLFSAGGSSNGDLPESSRYRTVDPKALSIYTEGGLDDLIRLYPWSLDYASYNQPELNRFYGSDED